MAEYIRQMDTGNVISYLRSVDKLVTFKTMASIGQQTPGLEEGAFYSPCAQVEVATFECFPSKVPTLVAMINSFLHIHSSPYILERFLITSQFHALIDHFADLGPLCRLYLLKTGTLARYLRLLFANFNTKTGMSSAAAQQMASDCDIEGVLAKKAPLIQLRPQSLYIRPNAPENQESKAILLERQNIVQNSLAPQSIMMHTIALLVRSYQFVKA
jgi:hypothetical protein